MYKLIYLHGTRIVESYEFPTKALAFWKRNQLIGQRTHLSGTFKIEKL
jgi:hypothetical protein